MKPPRCARLLASLVLPRHDRDVITGDLDEEFRQRARRGEFAARRWYWTEVVRSIPHALGTRLSLVLAQVPRDLHYAIRMWRRRPALTIAAIATQTVGIAVATAIVAVAYNVLIRPLPYVGSDRIVQIFEGGARPGLLSYRDFAQLRETARSFDALAGFSGGSRTLMTPGLPPERVASVEVTEQFFDVLGTALFAGRVFTERETRRGAQPVVILSHGAWVRRFGSDPDVVGRAMTLNGQPHTIVGVLPRDFEFPLRGLAELWLPLRPSPQQEERGYWHWMEVIGRRRTDVSGSQVDADLKSVAARFAARDARWHASTFLRVEPIRDVIVGGIRPTINALLAGVALVLIATCATLAALLLSSASSRSRELSVRSAIGAGRARMIRQLLTENVLLALAGGGAGLVAGHWLLRGFVRLMPAGQRAVLPHGQDIGVGPAVACGVTALAFATGLLFGVLPALRSSRQSNDALKSTRTTAGRSDGRLRLALTSVQIAVAFVLLAGAALLGTSVYRLLQVSPGFDPEGLVTMRLTLSARYTDANAVAGFHDQLLQRLDALPGVMGAALVSQAPLTGRGDTGALSIVERPRPSGVDAPEVGLRTVSPGYFDVMGVPLVRGRAFSRLDSPSSPGVVVVNQWLADRLMAGSDPLGQHITFEFAPGPWEIVGIVGNEQFDDLDKPMTPIVYFGSRQDTLRAFTIVVRTTQPATLMNASRGAVSELDPELPLFSVRTVSQIAADSAPVFTRRVAMSLLGVFAGAAVLLAGVALYGVLAQSVADRTREIGLRIALGATRRSIGMMILKAGALASVIGLLLGIAATFSLSKFLTTLLFGVRPGDPLIFAACAALLSVVVVAACLLPAARAVRIDPSHALRVE